RAVVLHPLAPLAVWDAGLGLREILPASDGVLQSLLARRDAQFVFGLDLPGKIDHGLPHRVVTHRWVLRLMNLSTSSARTRTCPPKNTALISPLLRIRSKVRVLTDNRSAVSRFVISLLVMSCLLPSVSATFGSLLSKPGREKTQTPWSFS